MENTRENGVVKELLGYYCAPLLITFRPLAILWQTASWVETGL